jgi:hypothetical protein
VNDRNLFTGLDSIWLAGTSGGSINGPRLIQELADRMTENHRYLEAVQGLGSSAANWCWDANSAYSRENRSLETMVEREIIRLTQTLGTWANQIPTDSGIGEGSSKSGHIDLGHRCTDRGFELIELKIASNKPAEAAFQIARYGLAYELFRRDSGLERNSGGMTKKLFAAQSIHLRVLAPSRYYCGAGDLVALESALCEGFDYMLEEERWNMDFAFLQFPNWFRPDGNLRDTLERALIGRGPLYSISAAANA